MATPNIYELLQQNLQATNRVRSVLSSLQGNLNELRNRSIDDRQEIDRNQLWLRQVSKENETLRRELFSLRQPHNGHLDNAAEFKPFSRLPVELRLKIWKFASFNEPRVVRLRVNIRLERSFYCPTNYPPSILHATAESRTEALKWYKRKRVEFGKYAHGLHGAVPPTAQTYFNFEIDILYPVLDDNWTRTFRYNWAGVVTKHRTIRQFRRVAIAHADDNDPISGWTGAAKYLRDPRSKIEEILVIRDGHLPLEIDQQLLPLSGDDVVWPSWQRHVGPSRVLVQDRLASINECLVEGMGDSDDDHHIDMLPEDERLEDILSEDEITTQSTLSTKDASCSRFRDDEDADEKETRPLPTIKFMYMRDSHRVPPPKIILV